VAPYGGGVTCWNRATGLVLAHRFEPPRRGTAAVASPPRSRRGALAISFATETG
jgi:hypothetical protein